MSSTLHTAPYYVLCDTNNEMQHTLQGADSVTFIKLLILRCYEQTAGMNNGGKSQQLVTARMKGARERRPWKNGLKKLKKT